jgi:hypothetical protein
VRESQTETEEAGEERGEVTAEREREEIERQRGLTIDDQSLLRF